MALSYDPEEKQLIARPTGDQISSKLNSFVGAAGLLRIPGKLGKSEENPGKCGVSGGSAGKSELRVEHCSKSVGNFERINEKCDYNGKMYDVILLDAFSIM